MRQMIKYILGYKAFHVILFHVHFFCPTRSRDMKPSRLVYNAQYMSEYNLYKTQGPCHHKMTKLQTITKHDVLIYTALHSNTV